MTNHERRLMRWMAAYAIATFIGFWMTTPARAHEQWADGTIVPEWVKSSCCGPSDVHHLRPDQAKALSDGWHVEGVKEVIPYDKEMQSQDGDYWVFYKTYGDYQNVYCFFAPPKGF